VTEPSPRSPGEAQVDRYLVYRLAGLLAVEGELHDGIAPGAVDSRGRFHDLTIRPAAGKAHQLLPHHGPRGRAGDAMPWVPRRRQERPRQSRQGREDIGAHNGHPRARYFPEVAPASCLAVRQPRRT